MDYQTGTRLLLYISIALLIGVSLRYALKKSRIPYTVVLLCLGILIGVVFETQLITSTEQTQRALSLISQLDPHLILFIFLPVLIFESAYSLEVHLFTRALSQISLLAIAGLILSMLMTATLMHEIFNWSWSVSMLFGALISATDPVAVVALLKEMNSRKRLQTLLEGESLLNDGTAIVLFSIFYAVLEQPTASFQLTDTVIEFIRVVLLGIATGAVLGWVTISWIKRVFNDALIEITLSIIIAYLAFYIAEITLHSSGIVAVVTIALIYSGPGRSRISPEVSHFLHQFWEVMAYFANTVIFLLAGFLIAPVLFKANTQHWLWLLIVFVSLIVIRAIVITILSPLLKHLGLGITKQKAIVLVWGGLRGAVALAMALVITHSKFIDQTIAQEILFFTGGVVFLSMIINATTMNALMKYLGLDKLPPERRLIIDKIQCHINSQMQQIFSSLKHKHWLKHANWEHLEQFDIVNRKTKLSEPDIPQEHIELAFRRRLLEIERKTYWNTLQKGIIEPDTASTLSEIVETILDGYPTIGPRKELLAHFSSTNKIRVGSSKLIFFVEKLLQHKNEHNYISEYELARAFVYVQHVLLNYVDILAPDESYSYEIKNEIRSNIDLLMPLIEGKEDQHSQGLEMSDTFTVENILSYRRRDIIQDMVESGLLDESEAGELIKETEIDIVNRQKSFLKNIK